MDFDFDAWSALARASPEEFERQRRDAIENLIAGAVDKHQLQVLQWRIDGERSQARTPLKACLRLSCLMWDTFFDLKDALDALTGVTNRAPPVEETSSPAPDAKVIPFRHAERKKNSP